jgi:hypothetical protein
MPSPTTAATVSANNVPRSSRTFDPLKRLG